MDTRIIANLYDFNERDGATDPEQQLETWWSHYYFVCRENVITGFLIPHLTTKGTKYTCKQCKEKIFDKYKITTREPWNPIYHVNCYKQLHENLMVKFEQFRVTEIEKVPDDEKKELTNKMEITING